MMVPLSDRCCGQPVASTVSGRYVFSSRSVKYELSNTSGASVQRPSKPERCCLQPPTVCPPESATMSRSSNPFGANTSRRCDTPLSPSGSLPTCDSTDSPESLASRRPKRVTTWGPPINSIATFAASAQRSAFEITPAVTYLSAIGLSRPIATSVSPAFASKVPSPESVKRITAFGQPPLRLPFENTPASCHDSRMRIGPQFLAARSALTSATMCSSSDFPSPALLMSPAAGTVLA
mmetsp:Transcript_27346/g.87838  ORF Transcript_27346/g.87838 Transcript_27346/m.87838 type:complete len:236 (-) Transcript_27346:48-755(-)